MSLAGVKAGAGGEAVGPGTGRAQVGFWLGWTLAGSEGYVLVDGGHASHGFKRLRAWEFELSDDSGVGLDQEGGSLRQGQCMQAHSCSLPACLPACHSARAPWLARTL